MYQHSEKQGHIPLYVYITLSYITGYPKLTHACSSGGCTELEVSLGGGSGGPLIYNRGEYKVLYMTREPYQYFLYDQDYNLQQNVCLPGYT